MPDRKDIWIFAEQNDGIIDASYYELLAKSKELFEGVNDKRRLVAVVLGNDNSLAIKRIRKSGVNSIISAEHGKLSVYHPSYFAKALYEIARTYEPNMILIGATAIGSELAPTVAAKLKTGLAAHCADIGVDESGEPVMIIPAFGGKLMGEILVPHARPIMATVKPGVFEKRELLPDTDVKEIRYDCSFLDNVESAIEFVGKEIIPISGSSIESAEVVICVGLGISSQENWKKANDLAEALKASICYTRPVVDMGYAPNEDAMVGTSGKMIKPKLYISFGVSGSSHHIFGIKDSGMIISINTDENADIFNISNYKVIGDSGGILDEMIRATMGKTIG